MLTREDNELLCRVGPGTPIGNLFRRYWIPALLSDEVPEPDSPPVRVRLLGEDLVAFRDTDGKVGLLDNYCPHRRASLFFGRNEECGLRCVYHGWKFDTDGNCVDMPSEPAESNFKDKVKVTAYPTVERGGAIFIYMGPVEKQPPFWNFEMFTLADDHILAARTRAYSNYMQGIEGNIDSSHISYLHRNLADLEMSDFDDGTDVPGFPSDKMSTKIRGTSRAPNLSVQETSYGWRYAGMRRTPNGNLHVRITTNVFPIFNMVSRLPDRDIVFSLFLPIDDENHWRWNFSGKLDRPYTTEERVARRRQRGELDENGVPLKGPWNDYLLDREAQKTVSYTGITGVQAQDMAIQDSMGTIVDRRDEHLGTTDIPVIHNRKVLLNAARALLEGIDPPMADPAIVVKVRSHEEIIPGDADWREYGAYAGEDVDI
jgi:phenylpropionate dioxygenase-like ring-hydroxylating dioxygenase large terminal subunit